MLSRRRLTALVLVGAVGTVAAGGELSKQDFVAAANTVCEGTDAYLFGVALSIAPSASNEEHLEAFGESFVPAYRDLHDRIDELAEPRADRTKIKRMLKALDREIDAVEDDPQRLGLPSGPLPRFEKLARRYGLTECAPA